MNKVKFAFVKAKLRYLYFKTKHPYLASGVEGITMGIVVGVPLRLLLSNSIINASSDMFVKGAETYRDAIASKLPEAYEIIREKLPDGIDIDMPSYTFRPLTGKITFTE